MEAATIEDRRKELRGILADELLFRTWYDTAARRVYAYLFGRCGGDAILAEELTQQVFVEAIRHRDSFDGRSDSITWLIAIGRNRLIDHLRRMEQEERRVLTAAHRHSLVSWSPDGAWLMLSQSDGWLYLIRPDGSGVTRWTEGTYPAWRPLPH